MDAAKFGTFIAESRKAKGMTQADLAKKLLVTDKAVSRWERGVGLPDINTIEPLANALELSVLEIMKSEKINSNDYSDKDTVEIMRTAIMIEKENQKQEQTATGLAVFTTIIVAILSWIEGLGNVLGSIFFGAIVSVMEISIYYYLENRGDRISRRIYAIIGLVTFVIFILILL